MSRGIPQNGVIENIKKEYRKNKENIAESIEAGAEVDDEFAEVVRLYQDNIQIITSPIIQDQLSDLFDTYGYEWVKKAIEEATLSNGRSLKYINAILTRWQAVGTKKPWDVQRGPKSQGQERMDELRQMYEEIMNE